MVNGIKSIFPYLSIALPLIAAHATTPLAANGDPERVVSQYWSGNPNLMRSKANSPGTSQSDINETYRAVLQNHLNATSAQNDRARAVQKQLLAALEPLDALGDKYTRVDCGSSLCEIVVVFRHVPTEGDQAQQIVDKVAKIVSVPSSTYRMTGPNIVTSGPDKGTGVSILNYVEMM